MNENVKKNELTPAAITERNDIFELNINNPLSIKINKKDNSPVKYWMIEMVKSGMLKVNEASELFGINRETLRIQKNTFNTDGLDGLIDKRQNGKGGKKNKLKQS